MIDWLRRPVFAAIVRVYPRLPFRALVLRRVTRAEGGQLRSATLRQILRRYHHVEAGLHSYGSLLDPGMADPHTRIGRYVSIGPNVRRFGASHPIDRPSLHPYWYNPRLGYVKANEDVERSPCLIDDDAWIGANTVILPTCHRIGKGAVVGAGSVVTRDVEDFSVVHGSPAREQRRRLSPEVRAKLVTDDVWSMEPDELQRYLRRLAEDGS